jgi:hypothetical protein
MWTACILREDLVDCDMDLLHVERSLSMMCSGSHLYSCYRLESKVCVCHSGEPDGRRLTVGLPWLENLLRHGMLQLVWLRQCQSQRLVIGMAGSAVDGEFRTAVLICVPCVAPTATISLDLVVS